MFGFWGEREIMSDGQVSIELNAATKQQVSSLFFPFSCSHTLCNDIFYKPYYSVKWLFSQPAGSASQLQGATVSFHNIHYKVKEREACLWAKRSLTKSILIDLKWVLPFQMFTITAIYFNSFWTCTFLLAIKGQKSFIV